MIFTGEYDKKPKQIVLSEEFFEGRKISLEVSGTMIYDGKKGDIIQQYILFTKVYKEQYKIYGRTQQTVLETIRICKDNNILKEYLESRQREVVNIMMTLFNQEYALEAYAEEIRQESRQEGFQEGELLARKETAQSLAKMGLSADQITQAVKVSIQTVTQWIEGAASLV